MLDISVCPQNVCGSVLSYMLAFSYIRVTIMLLYVNIIVSGMHASLLSLFAACKIWFYSHLQCPDRCKLLFRCREARFVHSCIEKHGNKKNLSWHFLSDSLKTPPMPVLAGVWHRARVEMGDSGLSLKLLCKGRRRKRGTSRPWR